LILSAHLHALYKTPKIVNNTYIVEPGGWTTHLGVSELYFKNKKLRKMKWDIKTSRDKSKADPELTKIGNKYYTIAYESQKEVIGKAEVKLIGIRSLVRSSETNLADLLCDAMRITGKADIALMNGGGIRQSIPAGNITIYQVGSVLPFVNKLVTLELKGDVIYKAIEIGLNVYPAADYGGGFLQVSGIKYTFDASKPAGKRLVSITKDGKPLDRNSYYKVATNDYLYNGGDRMDELINQKLIYSGDLLKNVLVDYIKEKSFLNPQLEGRITILNERYK
jgi:5'-nucleotidase/UDP-sugar diphosphatase